MDPGSGPGRPPSGGLRPSELEIQRSHRQPVLLILGLLLAGAGAAVATDAEASDAPGALPSPSPELSLTTDVLLALQADLAPDGEQPAMTAGSASSLAQSQVARPTTNELAIFPSAIKSTVMPWLEAEPTYAGSRLDPGTGQLVVSLTREDPAVVAKLDARVPGGSVGWRLESAGYTWQQLKAVTRAVGRTGRARCREATRSSPCCALITRFGSMVPTTISSAIGRRASAEHEPTIHMWGRRTHPFPSSYRV